MSDLVNRLQKTKGVFSLTPASKADIEYAEKQLGLSFANEYREFLRTFGAVSFESHEIVGITQHKRLNVVDVTKKEREFNSNIPGSYYVVEELNIDGIVIWQDGDGNVYQTFPEREPERIANSLSEYLFV